MTHHYDTVFQDSHDIFSTQRHNTLCTTKKLPKKESEESLDSPVENMPAVKRARNDDNLCTRPGKLTLRHGKSPCY